MKGFLAIAIIASAIYIGSAAVTKELATKIKAAGQACKEEHGVDDATYKDMVTYHKVPESEEGKCMVACFMKKMGYLNDKKFDLDAMKESNKHKWDDAAMVEKANALAEKCVGEATDANECHMAAHVVSCFMEKAAGEGITKPELE